MIRARAAGSRKHTVAGHSVFTLVALAALVVGASADDAILAKTYPRGAAKKLIVETDAGAISLRQTIDGPTAVDVSPAAKPGDDCRVTQELKGAVLLLSAHAAKNLLGMSKTCSAGFSVAGRFEDISLRSGSGEIQMDSSAGKVDARTGSAPIRANTHDPAGVVTLRSGSGAITGATAGAKLDAATGSGDIRLERLNGIVLARSGSGAISLDWTKAPPSGTIEVGTGSGNFTASFPKDTKIKASIRSAAGNIRNDFDDKDAKLALNFKSGSGDASVTRKP